MDPLIFCQHFREAISPQPLNGFSKFKKFLLDLCLYLKYTKNYWILMFSFFLEH